jgi:hypothetical protein
VIDNGRRMAYDEDLTELIRELRADEPHLSEERMFRGPAFLVVRARSFPPKA